MRGLSTMVAVTLAVLAVGAPAASGATCLTGAATFLFTGEEQCYQVPAGASGLSVLAVGGPGGDGGAHGLPGDALPGPGANGARVTARLAAAPADVLYVLVGGPGLPGTFEFTEAQGGAGGFNGGGDGGGDGFFGEPDAGGGGGGGASDVRTCSVEGGTCDGLTTLESRLLVAAGGGGGGGSPASGEGGPGGTGGIAAGEDGSNGLSGGAPGFGGGGATISSGGDPGQPGAGCLEAVPAQAGQLGEGGAGGKRISEGGGGGGGGGLFGGGGGGSGCGGPFSGGGGGGGGSSFGPSGSSFAADQTGTPLVEIVPRYTLEVAKLGSGSGEVTGSQGGLSCGSACAAEYDEGQEVTLSAVASPGSSFAGWAGGGCSGTGDCTVRIEAPIRVTAVFEAAPPDSPAPSVQAGRLFAAGRASVRGGRASLRVRCNGGEGSRCRGLAKLVVRGGDPKRQLKKGTVIGRARYDLPADGARRTLRVRLSKQSLKLLRRTGRRGITARLVANGLNRVVKLKLSGASR